MQKGWNTRRRHAEAGRDDTVIVDEAWRAICFSSGAPSGPSQTMFAPLAQLRSVIGDKRVMIGFDRGGAYPKVFAELTRRGFDFVTNRRAPPETPTVQPTRTWTLVEGRRRYMSVVDETVYATSAITVTLRRPDAPRVARSLGLLCDQLNANPPRMTGDRSRTRTARNLDLAGERYYRRPDASPEVRKSSSISMIPKCDRTLSALTSHGAADHSASPRLAPLERGTPPRFRAPRAPPLGERPRRHLAV